MLHPLQTPQHASSSSTTPLRSAAGKMVVPATPPPQHWMMGTEAFNSVMPHHGGIEALWETKWKFPCTKAVYPFHDGAYEDFEPVFRDLIARGVNDGSGTSPEYTRAFLAAAEELEHRGDAEADPEEASKLYLRAACVLRIARFPYIGLHPGTHHVDLVKWVAWERQKKVYMKAARTWESPIEELHIPHTFRQGADGDSIPVYVRIPSEKATSLPDGVQANGNQKHKHPVVILLTGLDGYRPDNTVRTEEFVSRGWAAVVFEIQGTADSPADPSDPASGDRLLDSVFAWIDTQKDDLDASRVLLWGLSSGGYHAVRAAHTHRERLRGVVAQGAGVHHFFDRDWLARADGHEYPFQLTPAMAAKHGYGSAEEFAEEAQGKFSLLELGVLQMPATRLLLINVSNNDKNPAFKMWPPYVACCVSVWRNVC